MISSRLRHAAELGQSLTDSLAYLEYDEAELLRTFHKLAAQWQDETGMLSFMPKKALHPAYQRIIGLGLPAVPLILQELERQPAHWFWALEAITGDNPVPPGATLPEARAAWLQWGQTWGQRG